MSGLTVSYTGSVTSPPEIRIDDEPFLFFNTVADGATLAGEASTAITVACFSDDVDALAARLPRLAKYDEVYVEGRLILSGLNGGRTGLSVVASRVEVLGQRGRVIGQIGRAKA